MFMGININYMFRVLIIVMSILFIVACIVKASKFIILGGVVIAILIALNIITLDSVKGFSRDVLEKVTEASETVSNYVKVDKDNCEIYFKINNEWVASEDLGDVKKDAGTYTIKFNGKEYKVDDDNLTKVLDIIYE